MSTSKLHSRIKNLHEQANELTLQMQVFCLDPNADVFNKCEANGRLKIEHGTNYELWRVGVLATYGPLWRKMSALGYTKFDFANSFDHAKITKEYEDKVKKTIDRIMSKPTSGLLDCIWYLYFATGDCNFLKIAFESGTYATTNRFWQDVSIDTYIKFTDMYRKYIKDITEQKVDLALHELNPLVDPNTPHPTQKVCAKFNAAISLFDVVQNEREHRPGYIGEKARELASIAEITL
jgi:hypothetical protein